MFHACAVTFRARHLHFVPRLVAANFLLVWVCQEHTQVTQRPTSSTHFILSNCRLFWCVQHLMPIYFAILLSKLQQEITCKKEAGMTESIVLTCTSRSVLNLLSKSRSEIFNNTVLISYNASGHLWLHIAFIEDVCIYYKIKYLCCIILEERKRGKNDFLRINCLQVKNVHIPQCISMLTR